MKADPMAAEPDALAAFTPHRRHLFGLAYRMLGSVADAEDVVQETWLRWQGADRDVVKEPRAFLSKVATRLSLDHLKSARSRRESYVGSWLPEPLVETVDPIEETSRDLSVSLLLALERLSPLERAAFLLHDVFDTPFSEVAATLGRSEAACRQLAARARSNVRAAKPRFRVPEDEGERIADAFFTASRSGDMEKLKTLLAEGVVIQSDGGGRVLSLLNPIIGREKVCRFFAATARRGAGLATPMRSSRINGLPGLITVERGATLQTTALEIEDGKIVRIFIVRNPDKLGHVAMDGSDLSS